jgi:hypothetical protein
MAAPLSALTRPGYNYLIPLHNDNYPAGKHEQDILSRMSRRSGMLLNMEELIPLLSPPVTCASRKLRRETKRTHPVPEMLAEGGTLSLGLNTHAGMTREVFLSPEHRVRHTHVIGVPGTGKSTFLLNLIRQDIESGAGVALFDPHGDLADTIAGLIPPERLEDVIVLDPSDEEYSVGLNILAAHSDFERGLLASDLTSVFRRLSTSWGDQMESVLRNGILAFLESSRGGTLADLRRFLLDASFRKEFLRTVTDPEIVYYWTKAFPQLTGGKSIGPLLTRLDEFLSRKPIRYMVSQLENRLDFADILDSSRILIVKLPQGLIGRENAALLGSLIIAKLQMAAMSRQRMRESERRDFWCYMDEFQHFITPSMAEILAGARKYRLGLILAHQELRHLDADRNVAGAVLSSCQTRVVFKVGDADARAFENGFSHFEARDLMNLGTGEAVCRVERSDFDFNLVVPKPERADEGLRDTIRRTVIAASRAKYARTRTDIEADLLRKRNTESVEHPETPKKAEVGFPKEVTTSDRPSQGADATSSLVPSETSSESGSPPADYQAGRGGPEHKIIQSQIQEAARSLGLKADVEKPIRDGAGRVDVSIEGGETRIACEISMTTTDDHEIGNVQKCLNAGYSNVIVLASEKSRLTQLSKTLSEELPPGDIDRVRFCLPRDFSTLLKKLIRPTPSPRPTKLGYKIKRTWNDRTIEENAEREREALRVIADILRGVPPT